MLPTQKINYYLNLIIENNLHKMDNYKKLKKFTFN